MTEHDLDPIDAWVVGDSRELTFNVTQDGAPRDVTDDTIHWRLFERAYQEDAEDAVLTEDSDGVSVDMDGAEDGVVVVEVAQDVTDSLRGKHTQKFINDPAGDTKQTWIGPVTFTLE